MIKNGLIKVRPDRRDYSLLHTFGAVGFDTSGLPDSFSIFDGRVVPDQNADGFPLACTAYSTTTIGGIEDGTTYPVKDFYYATPPGDNGGRDIRAALSTAKTRGFTLPDGSLGAKKGDYYTVYGAGKIDDFDAARIALYINQNEKRAVSVGSWWYPEFMLTVGGILPTPSFNTSQATLHNWIAVGWEGDYLLVVPWIGVLWGNNGVGKLHRTIYNGLLQQPYSGAYTLAKTPPTGAIPIGYTAVINHLISFIYQLYHNFAN